MLELSEKDRAFLKQLREAKVLQDVADHLLDQTNGIILVTCSDGDQMYDVFTKQVEYQSGFREDPRIHLIALNGAPIRIAFNSPANGVCRATDLDIMESIMDASRMKNIHTVGLVPHFPCVHATKYGINAEMAIRLVANAKDRIKMEGLKVANYAQIYWGEKKKNTYFLSRDKFKDYVRFNN